MARRRQALTTREAIMQVMKGRPQGRLETTILKHAEVIIDRDLAVGRRQEWPAHGELDIEDELAAMVDEGVLAWNPDKEEVPADRPLTYHIVDSAESGTRELS